MIQPHFEFAPHSIEQIIELQRIEVPDGSYGLKSRLWPVNLGHSDGAIERNHR